MYNYLLFNSTSNILLRVLEAREQSVLSRTTRPRQRGPAIKGLFDYLYSISIILLFKYFIAFFLIK